MVFVIHPMTGICRVPEQWLDAMLPSGFREATAEEIAAWYDEHGGAAKEHTISRKRRSSGDARAA